MSHFTFMMRYYDYLHKMLEDVALRDGCFVVERKESPLGTPSDSASYHEFERRVAAYTVINQHAGNKTLGLICMELDSLNVHSKLFIIDQSLTFKQNEFDDWCDMQLRLLSLMTDHPVIDLGWGEGAFHQKKRLLSIGLLWVMIIEAYRHGHELPPDSKRALSFLFGGSKLITFNTRRNPVSRAYEWYRGDLVNFQPR